jgi:uncharacterized cupin superfamily protein
MPIVIKDVIRSCEKDQGPNGLLKNKVQTIQGDLFMKRLVREPAGHITMEDFAPGVTISWYFWHEEVHYIVKGKAEMIFSKPPLHQKQDTITIEAGDVYLIHRGEYITWKVEPKDPLRHLCIIMPAPYIPTGEQLVAEIYNRTSNP